MKFKSQTILALAMLVVTQFASAAQEFRQEPATDVIVEHRDLRLYVDGGELRTGPGAHGKVDRSDQFRDFIWEHWKQRTRVYARLLVSGIDSTTTTYFFVEPGDSGAWRVACRQMNIGYPCPTCHRWFLYDTLYATSVQWTAARDAKRLVLKDSRGKKILDL